MYNVKLRTTPKNKLINHPHCRWHNFLRPPINQKSTTPPNTPKNKSRLQAPNGIDTSDKSKAISTGKPLQFSEAIRTFLHSPITCSKYNNWLVKDCLWIGNNIHLKIETVREGGFDMSTWKSIVWRVFYKNYHFKI